MDMFFLSLVIHIVFWKGIAEPEEPVSLVIILVTPVINLTLAIRDRCSAAAAAAILS